MAVGVVSWFTVLWSQVKYSGLHTRFRVGLPFPRILSMRRARPGPPHASKGTDPFGAVIQRFGQRVRELREAKGWTIERAAQRMGIDPKHLWKIERAWGSPNVTIGTLVRIAVGLDESVESLFQGAGPAATVSEGGGAGRPGHLRTVEPGAAEKYRTCVPMFDLDAAAGSFGSVQVVEDAGWVQPPTRRLLRPGMFVARVVGQSMEPLIPSGSHCLFSSPVEGSREGRILLVQHHAISDPETGGNYTVKRYQSKKVVDADGVWRHTEISLVPINPAHKPILLHEGAQDEVRVIAEFVEVLPP